MSQRHIKSLYDIAIKEYPENTNFGTLDEFYEKIQDPAKSKILYDGLIRKGYKNLGDYESFQVKISSKAPDITADSVLVIPEEVQFSQDSFKQNIYDSVKRQENSIAKNNPYGVNLPRKKSNVDRITSLGGKVMEGSQTLLEFDSLDNGLQVGEEIIDNILSQTNNDPSKFYSSYSGLPEDSPEVKSFVEIFNEQKKKPTPKQETNLDRIVRALEEGRDNPKFIMSAMSSNDPIKKLNDSISKMPKFAGLIQTDQITGLPRVQPKPTDFKKKYDALDDDDKYTLFKSEVVKRKREKDISERDAWKEVYKETGKTPPGLLDLAVEKSTTGGVLRTFGRDIGFNIRDYPEREEILSLDALEDFATSALSLVMPLDALLFAFGGGLGSKLGLKGVNAVRSQVKQIGKFADEVALKISKSKKYPCHKLGLLQKMQSVELQVVLEVLVLLMLVEI